ncbi:hypothetical protein L580_2767 [Serratia fonticola AU-P3(3)]|nr:hypothetical protein L580_2767 [Serratia fonticola AU-P3(3)]
MGSRDKRLHCVLDWGYMGDLGVRIKVEVTQEELTEAEFSGAEDLRQEIIDDLRDMDYPGFDVEVEIVDE